MRLGLNLGYWTSPAQAAERAELAREAERLGYSTVWVAEAYGSDSPTMLGWLAAKTERIGLGSAVMQIPARTPAMTAMTAASLDVLSNGRFRLGLGVSGPQVVEGWHGTRFTKPLGWTREYVEIVRLALSRQTVRHDGERYTLPLPDGPGKALKLALHPVSEHIPIYIAAVGPKNTALAGEIADGWLAVFFAPSHSAEIMAQLQPRPGFDVVATVPAVIGDDWESCADPVRNYAALYVGGMGSREKNFYFQLASRLGYSDAAEQIQDHYLAKRYAEAAAAVPTSFVDDTSLLGPKDRITDRLTAFAEAGVTTLALTPFASDLAGSVSTLRTVAEALEKSGVGE